MAGDPMPMFRCSARSALSDVSIEPIQEAGTRIQATMDDLPSRWVKGNSYPPIMGPQRNPPFNLYRTGDPKDRAWRSLARRLADRSA